MSTATSTTARTGTADAYRAAITALTAASVAVTDARATVQEQEAIIAEYLNRYDSSDRRHFERLQRMVRVLGDLRTVLARAANTEYAATRAAGEARFAMVDALPDAVREVL